MKITKRITADDVAERMNDVDKCCILIELLEYKNQDADWHLAQTLSVIKDLLKPVVTDLIELAEQMDEEESKTSRPALKAVA